MIKKETNAIVNDCYCIKYSITIPTEKQEHNYEYYINKIKEQIPEEEEIFLEGGGYPNNFGKTEFHIYTKKKKLLEQEKEITKTLEENGYEISFEECVQINEHNNYVKLDICRMTYNKKTIENICNLIKATNWEISFDDFGPHLICIW